jgi:XTP/dITP diphosphohydrolase
MKIVFATHNKNKFREVKSMMPAHIELLSLDDIDCHEDIPETATTIEGNALLKSRFIKRSYKIDCFADDTGLEVEALDNAPGVFSARYAGPDCNAEDNISKLLLELDGIKSRSARFKTAISLSIEDREIMLIGICKGRIIDTPKGNFGFGYDPVFQPEGYEITFAEMKLGQKSEIGHRGKAIRKLIDYLSRV